MSPNLPNFSIGNNPGGRRDSDSEQQNQIVWVDSEDVYKPIPKKVSEFTAERGIQEAAVSPVYLKAEALNSLKVHLASNLRVEQGGILFGNAYEDPFLGIYVEIIAAVAAPATIGTGSHLEFTPDSWLGIMNYARSEHPDENIVGWYHSHPNMGVFMSGTDMRTQQAFFSHPWCLSIVHDPVSKAIGYFLGETAVPVKPVIFGRIKSVNEPPEDRKENISAIEDINTQIGGSLVGIDKQPEISPRKQNKFLSLPLWVWLMLLVAIAIILVGPHLHNTISESTTDLPNSTASKLDFPFKASLKKIPATVLRYLENEKTLLRYPVVKAGEKLGTGEEVTLLVISKQGTEIAKNIQLEVKQLIPNRDVELVEVIDSFKAQTTSLINYDNYDSVIQLKPLPLKLSSPEAGVMIPLFSYKFSSGGTSVNSDRTKSNKIQKGEIIYVPIKLIYKDSNENQKEVELKEILKNGSESE